MPAGTVYAKRFPGGFVDLPSQTTEIDQTFLNAVEAALLQLIGSAPTADGQVMQWDNANTRYGPALLLNKNVDAAAAIASSKIDFTGGNALTNAAIAGAAAIARSKLDFGSGLVNADVAAAAAIALSKISWSGNAPFAPYRKATTKTVNTTVAATDLLNAEITIAAGLMTTTGCIRVTIWGDFLNNSGALPSPPRWQLIFGGTTLIDTGTSGQVPSAATRYGWKVAATVLNMGAANSQTTSFFLSFSDGASTSSVNNVFTTGEGAMYGPQSVPGMIIATGVNPSTAVNTALANALVFNVINGSASANYETKLLGALVEVL